MIKEKTYTFPHKEEGKKETFIEVPESKLTKPQKEQLLMELVNKWDTTPAECQHHFVEMLTAVIKEVKQEKGNEAPSIISLHKH